VKYRAPKQEGKKMNTDCTFCNRVRAWLRQPFKEDGSALDWFLFVGLIGAISWLWSRILVRILD
jgi:hypothetical protein